eukprot:jgi/Tetstr1/432000/TSEL_021476.t1
MPELVEVEVVRRLCDAHVVGRQVAEVWVDPTDAKVLSYPCPALAGDAAGLSAFLLGAVVVSAERKGKQLVLRVQPAGGRPVAYLFVHLGMTGTVCVEGVRGMQYQSFTVQKGAEWPPPYRRLEVTTTTGARWAYCDPRRFGKLFLSDGVQPLAKLAPDALLELPPAEAFAVACARRSGPIKALLLDQGALVSGIGNWIADEVLYQAKIHPESPACALGETDIGALRAAIVSVLDVAIALSGENFPPEWLFHHRWGKGKGDAQRDAAGRTVTHVTVGGRTSAVVLAIQKKLSAGAKKSIPRKRTAKQPGSVKEEVAPDVKDAAVQMSTIVVQKRSRTSRGVIADAEEGVPPAKRSRKRRQSQAASPGAVEDATEEKPARAMNGAAKAASRKAKQSAEKPNEVVVSAGGNAISSRKGPRGSSTTVKLKRQSVAAPVGTKPRRAAAAKPAAKPTAKPPAQVRATRTSERATRASGRTTRVR